jgi:adenylate cyclase, class 2
VPIEQEIKLAFETIEAARQAVVTAGGRLVRSRRLLDDQLFDTDEAELRRTGMALRIRRDGDEAVLTWKGPSVPGPVKSREELETSIGDAGTVAAMLAALGYLPRFRSQKFREEYDVDAATVTIDEAPCGIYVEIEAIPEVIDRVAALLGRTPADYCVESYSALWRHWCLARNRPFEDMLF